MRQLSLINLATTPVIAIMGFLYYSLFIKHLQSCYFVLPVFDFLSKSMTPYCLCILFSCVGLFTTGSKGPSAILLLNYSMVVFLQLNACIFIVTALETILYWDATHQIHRYSHFVYVLVASVILSGMTVLALKFFRKKYGIGRRS